MIDGIAATVPLTFELEQLLEETFVEPYTDRRRAHSRSIERL